MLTAPPAYSAVNYSNTQIPPYSSVQLQAGTPPSHIHAPPYNVASSPSTHDNPAYAPPDYETVIADAKVADVNTKPLNSRTGENEES